SQTVSAADNGKLVSLALNSAGLTALNAARGGMAALGGALTSISGTASQIVFLWTEIANDVRQLVLDMGSVEDWYTIDVSDTANKVKLETSTPSDGPNEFVNALNPHIELYDQSNTLVASGISQADGRTESIEYQPTTMGSYRVRVTSENGTVGEYFLGRSTAPGLPIG